MTEITTVYMQSTKHEKDNEYTSLPPLATVRITQKANSSDWHYQTVRIPFATLVYVQYHSVTFCLENLLWFWLHAWAAGSWYSCLLKATIHGCLFPPLPSSPNHPQHLANRRRHLLFVKFSGTLNLANLVNQWKPTSWMLKVLLLDSNNPILAMIRKRKGHKTLFCFVYVRTVEIPHRCLVAHIFRLINLSYFQEKPGKIWTEKKVRIYSRTVSSLLS